MNKYLVTGAAGFIGSNVARCLIAQGYEVVTIDNLSTGKREVIPDGCELIEGNDFDPEVIEQLYHHRFDGVIHIAGQSSGEVSFENPVYDLHTNAQSTIMLLDYVRKTKCPEFLFASSMAVYGDLDNSFVTEETVPTPKSFYAVGKLASEHYMRIYSQIYGIRCTALRFFNVFGVGQNLDNLKQGMASIYLAMALRDGHITVKGDADRFRDFVYIDDVVGAVMLAINRKCGKNYEVYNVSNSRQIFVRDIIAFIEDYLPFKVSHEYVEGTLGDQKGVFGSNDKIKRDLEWSSKYNFEEGMKMMIDWAISNIK